MLHEIDRTNYMIKANTYGLSRNSFRVFEIGAAVFETMPTIDEISSYLHIHIQTYTYVFLFSYQT